MKWHDVEQNGPEWDALRLGKATVVQEQIYGDILLMPRGRGKDTHAGA